MAKTTLIGSLKISLLAVTKPFNRGLGRASKQVKKFTRFMRTDLATVLPLIAGRLASLGLSAVAKAFRTATRFALIFATAIGITLVASITLVTAALGALGKNSFKTIDTIAKTSRRLGIAVENMAGMTLAAKEAGIEFNTFTLGLQRMTRRIAEAAQGMGEAKGALEELNLDAKELATLSPDKQFLKIADALAKVESQGEKIRLGFKLFDSEGVANILVTADALREANEAARILGVELTDINIAKIEAANDAAGRMKLAFVGIGNTIAITVAPFVEALANFMVAKFTEAGTVTEQVNTFLAKLGPLAEGSINLIGEASVNALQFIGDALSATSDAFTDLNDFKPSFAEEVLRNFKRAASGLKLTFTVLRVFILGALRVLLIAVQEAVNAPIRLINLLLKGIREAREFLTGKAGPEFKIPLIFDDSGLKEFAAQAVVAAKTVQDIVDDALAFEDRLGKGETIIPPQLAEGLRTVTFEASNAAEALRIVLEEFKNGVPFAEAVAAALDGARSSYTKIGIAAQEAGEGMQELKDEAEKLTPVVDRISSGFDDLGNDLANSLLKGENAFESLAKTAVSALNDIATALFKKGLFTALFSLFGGGTGPVASIFGGLAGISPTPSVSSPGLGSVPSLAGGGGQQVNINFLGDTMGDDAIREQVAKGITQAQPALTNAAVNATSDRAQRDPNFRRQFA